MDLDQGIDEETAVGLTVLIVSIAVLKNSKIVTRGCWERPHLGPKKRKIYGQMVLLDEMRISDVPGFVEIIRLCPESFDKLLSIVGPLITKCSNREPINPSTRLAVTLRYLATGEDMISLAYNYRLGESTTHGILWETLGAIYNSLQPLVLPDPTTETWLNVADGFYKRWNVPNCSGALDGKHVRVRKPAKSGSEYWNFKGYCSTVMMSTCDAFYRFITVDTGCQGRNNDVIVFNDSGTGKKLMDGTLGLPGYSAIENGPILPHFLLADEIFGLQTNIMVPYPGRGTGRLSYEEKIYNYRHARGRRVIENTYGIFSNVWRIFLTEINASPPMVDRIVLAAACLHNFRINENGNIDEFMNSNDSGRQNRNLNQMDSVTVSNLADSRGPKAQSRHIRSELAQYFVNGGSVYWQNNMIH